jgi:hypothetical protein
MNAPSTAVSPSLEELYPGEASRWMLFIGLPFLAAGLFVGLAFATSVLWYWAGAIVLGPGVGIAGLVYVTLSSDTNGIVEHAHEVEPALERAAEVLAVPAAVAA